MADPRFFTVVGPFSLSKLAEVADANLGEGCNGGMFITDVASLDKAQAGQVSFLDNKKYIESLEKSQAGAVILHPDMIKHVPSGMVTLLSKDPYRSYAKVAQLFYPKRVLESQIAPSAIVASNAVVGEGCVIEAGAVIGALAQLGKGCHIGFHAVIGDGVILGDDCVVEANVTITHAIIGNRSTFYTGSRIGQDGFGFAMGPQGHLRIPQLGRVIIGNDVEVGANSTIDRGAGPDTVIGDGCMIDNLVQIGHNVQMGRGCVIVSQVGISGSTKLGDFVVVGGQVGMAGHLNIGTGVKIAAQSGVMRDLVAGESVAGTPSMPIKSYMRKHVSILKLLNIK